MSILIQGMEMPAEHIELVIYEDGHVAIYDHRVEAYQELDHAMAIPVPAHGRLIDADALISRCADEKGCYYGHESAVIGEAAESAPTIIPADHFGDTNEMVKAEEGSAN